jgi:hypothetical protein
MLFIPPFLAGYEGPSVSVRRSWSEVPHITEELAKVCKMNLQRGRIIVDDYTQAGVVARPVTIPQTYLSLQAKITGMSLHDAIISVKPNYAILRCSSFAYLDIVPQGRIGEICCYSFSQ